MKPLRGGLKLDGKKEATLIPWSIVRPSVPRRVRPPLKYSSSLSFQPLVQVGDRVRTGERIAQTDGEHPLGLHASISGKVSEVGDAIEILSDGKDETLPPIGHERVGWESLSSGEIFKLLRDSGIELPAPRTLDTLILNGCESEPYLTSDHCLMMSHPVEILRGGEILGRAFQAKNLVLVLEDNKEEVAELLKSKIFFHTWSRTRIEVLPARYPLEEERILIRELLGLDIGPAQAGVTVLNVAFAFAVYEAVVLQKPFYERVVTIGGECTAQPRNFWVRIGTSVEEAVKYARGFLRQPEKVILGGPMTGRAIETLDTPVLKGTRGILGLPREVTKPETIEPCIRCNRCVESCPVFISPVMITLAAEKGLWEVARDYGASFCIECGNCSTVCPAKRPMVELIQYANSHVR